MKKIYLSPSNQTSNVGLYKDYGLNECEACKKIAEETRKALAEYDCEIIIAKQSDNMTVRGNEANTLKADCYVSIHSNAYKTETPHGTEVLVKAKDGSQSEVLATLLCKKVSAVFGASRGVKAYSGYETNIPTMPHCLVETGFHTSPADVKILAEKSELVGSAIAEAIVEFLKLEKKAEEIPVEPVNEAMTETLAEEKDYKKVDKGTIIRTSLLIMSIVNQIIAVIGSTSFANATWYQIVSLCATAITAIVSAWENNDWTFFARLGTGVLDALEDGKITVLEVKELIDKKETDK